MWAYLLYLRNNYLLSLSKDVGDPEAELCLSWKSAWQAEPAPPLQLLRVDKEPATLVPSGYGEGGTCRLLGKTTVFRKSSCFSHPKLRPGSSHLCPSPLAQPRISRLGPGRYPVSFGNILLLPSPCSCFSPEQAPLRLVAFIKTKTRVYRWEHLIEGMCGWGGG